MAETVQHFITAMDSIKLNLVSVDALHPLISDIVDSLNKNISLPPDFDGKVKLRNWYVPAVVYTYSQSGAFSLAGPV